MYVKNWSKVCHSSSLAVLVGCMAGVISEPWVEAPRWVPLLINFADFLGEFQLSIPLADSPLKLSISPFRFFNL